MANQEGGISMGIKACESLLKIRILQAENLVDGAMMMTTKERSLKEYKLLLEKLKEDGK